MCLISPTTRAFHIQKHINFFGMHMHFLLTLLMHMEIRNYMPVNRVAERSVVPFLSGSNFMPVEKSVFIKPYDICKILSTFLLQFIESFQKHVTTL
jgi:hypothetical protein